MLAIQASEFPSGWCSPADCGSICRTCEPALRARCISTMHRGLRSTVVSMVGERIGRLDYDVTRDDLRLRRKRYPNNLTAPIPSKISDDGSGTAASGTTNTSLIAYMRYKLP